MDADERDGRAAPRRGGAVLGRPRIYAIPPGAGFADALAAGILARWGGEPLGLARVIVLLPTRRAVRTVAEAFLRASAGRPLLLPQLRPLGDVADEDLAFEAAIPADELALPPAIAPLRRRLLLAALVGRARGAGPAQAAQLAEELARLLDRLQVNDVPLERLAGLAPADHARHWQQTLDFLHLLAAPWRDLLAAEGAMDAAERRNRLVRAQAAAWRARPPETPVVAAGSTGSLPATADLLDVVARLPEGMVVLPGLDGTLDEAAWEALEPGHPYHSTRALLARLDVPREAVADWPAPGRPPPAQRLALLSEALRPAATTERWQELPRFDAAAIAGVARADCAQPQEEATVVALALRRQLETPGTTAVLVTPDRGLARRVAAELARWDIAVDDSAGEPLALTPPGAFLSLAAEAAAEGFAPLALLALLKHPLALAGSVAGAFRALVREVELAALRGPRPAPGLAGLRAALPERARARLPALDRLATAAAPFERLATAETARPADLLATHVAFAEWLASDADGRCRLWDGEAGEAAAAFVAELAEAAEGMPALAGADWPALLAELMGGVAVRPRWGRHPRLAILGPLEARLQSADLVVLGGLNEGTWPAEPAADPWLNRTMQAQLGLPPPELRVGLAAHDFLHGAAAPNVLLTRAEKVGGTPTVASRWLLRLDAVLRAAGLDWPRVDGERLKAWAAALDRPAEVHPLPPPEPRPPVAARPRQLSVTRIETWRRDPYAIFARHILRLEALDPLDQQPDAAERGIAVHAALDRFVRAFPEALPDDAVERLLAEGEAAFGELLQRPGIRAFWWPRFRRIAEWFVAEERQRRPFSLPLATEARGRLELAAPFGPFALTATADRIDRQADGTLEVIDYKTGTLPRPADLLRGDAPQLPLEAAMLARGAFPDVPAAPVSQLAFWRLSGGRVPGEVAVPNVDVAAAAATALGGLEQLVARFDDAATPYLARPRPGAEPRFSDYEHLARVREWAQDGGDDA